jgi:hypothetical protein
MIKSKTWVAKAVAVNLLSRLPFHEHIHFLGQRLLGRHRLDAAEMFSRALELFRLLRHVGASLENADLLEIGTGWFAVAPIMAYLLGARQVTTVDIHPWLRRHNTLKVIESIEPFLQRLSDETETSHEEIQDRYEVMRAAGGASRTLEGLLQPLNIRYLSPCDLVQADIESESVDAVISSNVLEHVPPDVLVNLHGAARRILRKNGYIVHRISTGDHYVNLTGSAINFIKYSEKAWAWLGGSGLSYHNRLRTTEHVALLSKAGLGVVLWAESLHEESMRQMGAGEITPVGRFADMPADVLCAFFGWLVLCKKRQQGSVEEPVRVKWIDDLLTAPSGWFQKQGHCAEGRT